MGNILDGVWDGWVGGATPLPAAGDLIENSTNFPFLCHSDTVRHVTQSKVMFVMRGLPGSGKSTLVRLLKEKYPSAVVCSADDYFLCEDGSYQFDASKLSVAHDICQGKTKTAVERGDHVVIIDNTNVRRWELNFYMKLANEYNYTAVVVTPRTPWCFNPVELATRNKHGVSEDILTKKVTVFETIVPVFYGWFLNETASDMLYSLGQTCFHQCLDHIPQFNNYLQLFFSVSDFKDSTLSDFYGRRDSSSNVLHCTAYFAGRGRESGTHLYSERASVQESLGRAFSLSVIGVVVTPRTVGARVKLDQEQLQLWAKDDREGKRNKWDKTAGGDPVSDFPGSSSQEDSTVLPPGRQSNSRFCPTSGPGSRAHITLGYTSDSSAVQAGLDLIEVIECEHAARNDHSFTNIERGAVRYYGDGCCVVYFSEPVKVSTLFSARY